MDYLRQTNLLLGEGTNLGDAPDLAAIDNAFSGFMHNAAPPPVPAVEEKKERKKRTHDPNAPKRPLTPYFLYMQTARPIIANDLGETAPKGAVQEEGQRRWGIMGADEKQGWNQAYQYNLKLYQARVHAYKAGNLDAKNMPDDEALKYADKNALSMPDHPVPVDDVMANEQDAIAEQLQQGAVAEDEEEAAPAAKTPKKANNTRKRKTATPAAESDDKPAAATPASPDKKRRRTSTKVPDTAEKPKGKPGRKAKA